MKTGFISADLSNHKSIKEGYFWIRISHDQDDPELHQQSKSQSRCSVSTPHQSIWTRSIAPAQVLTE